MKCRGCFLNQLRLLSIERSCTTRPMKKLYLIRTYTNKSAVIGVTTKKELMAQILKTDDDNLFAVAVYKES